MKLYTGIDIIKLICAFLIVFLHTFCYDFKLGYWIKDVVTSIGVPYFFIASGFFLKKGLNQSTKRNEYIKKYLKRLLYMYLVWTVVTLPISWWNLSIAHGNYNFFKKVIHIVRQFCFSGSLGIYWFLLALICGAFTLYLFEKKKKLSLLFVLSFLLFLLGISYNSGILDGSLLYNIIHIIYGSERNFLTVGLFYLCIGHWLAKDKLPDIRQYTLFLGFILALIIATLLWKRCNFVFMQAVLAVLLFMLSAKWNPKNTLFIQHSINIRKLSTAIYLAHFPFILVFDYFLKRGTLIDFFAASAFAVAMYFSLKYLLPHNLFKYIYG